MINEGGIYVDGMCHDLFRPASWYACERGALNIVKILFAYGASMTTRCVHSDNKKGLNAIEVARRNGHTEVVEFLETLKNTQVEIFKTFMLEKQCESAECGL